MTLNRSLLAVGFFTALYLLIAAAGAVLTGNVEFIFYIVVVLVLAAIALLVHARVGLSMATLWALSLWGLLHMVGGLVPLPTGWPYNGDQAVFYSWWIIPEILKYDHIVHAYGFAVATWVCWQAVRPLLSVAKPSFGILALCALGGMGLGALNEIVEFTAVLLVPNTNVGGYINTGWDLVANATGCLVAAVLIRLKHSS